MINEKIVDTGTAYYVKSEHKDKEGGPKTLGGPYEYSTPEGKKHARKKAELRLRQVEYFKHIKEETDMTIDEAKSPEEQEAFDKAEKEVASKLGLSLPLPKDTPRDVRNKFYAQVNVKCKKSNVGKCLDKLKEDKQSYKFTIKYKGESTKTGQQYGNTPKEALAQVKSKQALDKVEWIEIEGGPDGNAKWSNKD